MFAATCGILVVDGLLLVVLLVLRLLLLVWLPCLLRVVVAFAPFAFARGVFVGWRALRGACCAFCFGCERLSCGGLVSPCCNVDNCPLLFGG